MSRRSLMIATMFVGACATQGPKIPYGQSAAPEMTSGVSINASRAEEALATGSSDDPNLAAATRRRMNFIKSREGELHGWVMPLLQSYLPEGVELEARIYLGANLPEPLSVVDGAVLVDVASPVWGEADETLWNTIVRTIYRTALTAVLPEPAKDADALNVVLARVMKEGVLDFVAAQGRPDDEGRLTYRIAERRRDVMDRFASIDDATRTLRGGGKGREVLRVLDKADASSPLFGVVGSTMAQVIEREQGRAALVALMVKGPEAFYQAYQKTGPGALLNFRVPELAPGPTEGEATPTH